MMDIKAIFEGNLRVVKENHIKTILVEQKQHLEGIIRIAKSIEPNFSTPENIMEIIHLLFNYFTGNPNFVKLLKELTDVAGSLNKGLMLVGGVGVGKTLLFAIFRYYTQEILGVNSFRFTTAIDIIDDVNKNGVECLEVFSHNLVHKTPRPITCYIDDIACKKENINHYGTNINVIEQLLYQRYNVLLRYGVLTHTSSNKYPAQMKEVYDMRIIDRMSEMFNFIELTGNSYRK